MCMQNVITIVADNARLEKSPGHDHLELDGDGYLDDAIHKKKFLKC